MIIHKIGNVQSVKPNRPLCKKLGRVALTRFKGKTTCLDCKGHLERAAEKKRTEVLTKAAR